jgi:hypothetical protein
MSFAVVVPTGPGTAELDRVADLADALHRYEPGVARLVLVDDEPDAHRDVTAAAGPLADRTTVIANPRDRSADWWSEGVLVGIAAGLGEVLAGPPVDWVLRMDTDALICGPFAASVGARLAADPTIGLVGTFLRDANGVPIDNSGPAKPIRKLVAPVSLWKQQRTVKTSLWGLARERRDVVREAEDHGYRIGIHCQGGAYGVSWAAISAIARRGWLDARLWRGTYLSEDWVMAIQVFAVGLRPEGMSGRGEPFAIQHVGLPGTPEQLVADGRGVVHSLKDTDGQHEDEVRAAFRHLRGAPVDDASASASAGPA